MSETASGWLGRNESLEFRVSCLLECSNATNATLLCNFRARESALQRVLSETISVMPEIPSEVVITQPDENRFDRIKVGQNQSVVINYTAQVEVRYQYLNPENLRKIPPANLQPAQLPYLLPSRYCQSDLLGRFAWQKFGHISNPCDQVWELVSWIHKNIQYLPGTTTSATSAYDSVTQCAGVCRDFAHLGIALCRALNIPARYFTGYAFELNPPDFHACFEAYLGGSWVLFDATKLTPLNGLVSIGTGRDAADVSVCTIFGYGRLSRTEVNCEAASPTFAALPDSMSDHVAVSIDMQTVPS